MRYAIRNAQPFIFVEKGGANLFHRRDELKSSVKKAVMGAVVAGMLSSSVAMQPAEARSHSSRGIVIGVAVVAVIAALASHHKHHSSSTMTTTTTSNGTMGSATTGTAH